MTINWWSIYCHYYYWPSLRSTKRFRAVSEQRTRNENQRPPEKWGEYVKDFHFLSLVPFFPKIPRFDLFLLRNQTETFATQATIDHKRIRFYQAFDTLLTTVKRFFLRQGTAWYSFNCTLNDGRAKLSSNLVNMAGDLLYKVPLTLWLPLLCFFDYQLNQERII